MEPSLNTSLKNIDDQLSMLRNLQSSRKQPKDITFLSTPLGAVHGQPRRFDDFFLNLNPDGVTNYVGRTGTVTLRCYTLRSSTDEGDAPKLTKLWDVALLVDYEASDCLADPHQNVLLAYSRKDDKYV